MIPAGFDGNPICGGCGRSHDTHGPDFPCWTRDATGRRSPCRVLLADARGQLVTAQWDDARETWVIYSP